MRQESSGCSLEVRRSKNLLVVAGPAEAVVGVVAMVQEMFQTHKQIVLEVRFDPEQKGASDSLPHSPTRHHRLGTSRHHS